MNGRPLDGERIGVFGKGGSGKSTVTVFLAAALAEAGYPVVVLDADSTNHGLAAALGMNEEPRPLLDYFGGMVFSGGSVTCPVDDPTLLPGARLESGQLPEAFIGRNATGVRLLVAGKLGALGPGAGCDGPVAKIARDLRVDGVGSTVTVVDFKAGFEDAARGTLTTVDQALVVVDPTTAAVGMARHLAAMVDAIRRGVPPATQHLERPELVQVANRLFQDARVRRVSSVLNRIGSPGAEAHLRGALAESGAPILAVFPEEPDIAEQWLRGERLEAPQAAEAARTLVCELEGVVPDWDANTRTAEV
ncbi:MAG: P-loop NTPase [Gemmatimonadota bacterium]|jgi:CO dehydrogenase maturation factor